VIAKITRGSSARGLAEYLHGPGRAQEHSWRTEKGVTFAGGRVIAGWMNCCEVEEHLSGE